MRGYAMTASKPLAVHLHIYYASMWPLMQQYLSNIGDCPYRLFVTMPKENAGLAGEIQRFCPESKIYITENRGYDVGPFIHFLHQINLEDYDYILKIHTKSLSAPYTTATLNGYRFTQKAWTLALLDGLLGTPQIFKDNIRRLQTQPGTGMIASPYFIIRQPLCSASMVPAIENVMGKLGYICPPDIPFVAGTMFLVRSRLMQKIKENFSLTDFPLTVRGVKDETPAHVFERVFGCVTEAAGYKIEGSARNKKFERHSRWRRILRFFYSSDITSHQYLLVKVCKIPVYRKKVPPIIKGS